MELRPERGAVRCRLRLDDLRDLTARGRSLSPTARPRRRSTDGVGAARPRSVSRRAWSGADRACGCRLRRRLRARRPSRDRPAGLGRRGADRGGAVGRALRGAAREPVGAVTHRFPTSAALAQADPSSLPMPRSRAKALRELARLVARRRAQPRRRRGTGCRPWPAFSRCPGSAPGPPPTSRCERSAIPTPTRSAMRGCAGRSSGADTPSDRAAEERLAEAWRPGAPMPSSTSGRSLEEDALCLGR